ncbi:MAG TPA: hypothetical protein VHH72_01705 [Solirubrobacterales bacterium]|jgi:hypothetical protein|nr:hypothetical protein [Solirubrobacterales bacterium]
MLSAILAGALIVAASLLLGAAIMVAAGRPRHSAAGPAAGVSALLVVCGVAIKLPGHGVTAAAVTGAALVASFLFLARSRAPLGAVRLGALVAVGGAALVIAIPFATSGRVGILGQGLINDDMASHLLFAEWVDSREGPAPDLIDGGYPLGPHAVVSAASKATGADLVESFAGLTGAIAVLAALTAYGALAGVRGRFRGPAAVLCALPYLSAAYLAQGAFKEPLLGLALVGFALSLPPLRAAWSGRRRLPWTAALPAGAIAAGTIYNYSFPGLAWLLLAVVAWALIVALWERGSRGGLDLGARLRSFRTVLVAGVVITALCTVPELIRLAQFADFEAFSPEGKGPSVGFGNLRQPLNPLEAFGVWPSSEFRIAPRNSSTPEIAFYLGGLLGLAAAAWGLGRAVARREAALPAAFAAGALGYLVALAAGTPYTQAKALAVLAPVAMLISLRGLLAAGPVECEGPAPGAADQATWWPPRPLRPLVRFAVPALAAAFVLAAAFSTLLPLRQSAVGPTETSEELIAMRPLVADQDVLFLGRDNFISWELLGAHDVFAPILNHYDTEETATLYRATPINAKFDWDNVPASGAEFDAKGLEDFDWVITTAADFNSQAPPEFAMRMTGEDFILWEREPGAATLGLDHPGGRRTLLEPLYPGATADCVKRGGAAGFAELSGTASVFEAAPVVGRAWDPNPPDITDGEVATEELPLAPGSWAISIQYASTQPLRVSAPGFDRTLDTNLLFRGPAPYYPVGTIEVPDGAGPVRFTVTVGEPPLVGRALGTESRAYLGRIAATPAPAPAPGAAVRDDVPLREACGRYVDWYTVATGASPAALAAMEAPTPRPPEEDD